MSSDLVLGIIILAGVLLLLVVFVIGAFRTIDKLAARGGRSSRAFRRSSHVE